MKRIGAGIAIFAVLLVPSNLTDAQRRGLSDADANEAMRQVVATYGSFATYSDKGTCVYHPAGGDRVYTVRFETLFKRPGRLRFAWTQEVDSLPGYQQKGVIWCDGTTAWLLWSVHGNRLEQKKDLELAVSGAVGASWGAAGTIAKLLCDDLGEIRRLDELEGLRIDGNATEDGVECVVLAGHLDSGTKERIWISREDHLVRRIEERSKYGTHVEVRTQIVIDQEIADSRFSEQG